jgi:hypothetical protein
MSQIELLDRYLNGGPQQLYYCTVYRLMLLFRRVPSPTFLKCFMKKLNFINYIITYYELWPQFITAFSADVELL